MPPKCKFTREEIIQAALDIARNEGFSCITARALGNKLGSSSKPIFSIFENMEEVQEEVIKAAKNLYADYVNCGLQENPAFKGVGKQYILFAIKEPKLFQLLFMNEREQLTDINNVLPIIDDNYDKILASITGGYGIKKEKAKILYKHLWVYSHGIATLCATKMCSFKSEEISEMITQVFVSLLKNTKEQG